MKPVSAATAPALPGDASSSADAPLSTTYTASSSYVFLAVVAFIVLAARLHALVGGKRRKHAPLRTVHSSSSPRKRCKVEVGDGRAADETSVAKSDMLCALRSDRLPDGTSLPVDHPSVAGPLEQLKEAYQRSGVDCRTSPTHPLDGDYLMEHSPSFIGKLGYNSSGEPLFTLGRMTFSMIRPTDAVCSLQRVTQHVHRLGPKDPLPEKMPPKLRDAVEANAKELRTFVTNMYFTVESDPGNDLMDDRSDVDSLDGDNDEEKKDDVEPRTCAPSREGPRGIMRMDGYCFPHPTEPNRLSVWFSGGVCSPQRGQDPTVWRRTFGRHLPARPLSERLTLLAAKAFMGAVPIEGLDPRDNASVRFELRRPVAAHQDVAFLDDDVRVTVGNKGTVVVCTRLGGRSMERKSSMLER